MAIETKKTITQSRVFLLSMMLLSMAFWGGSWVSAKVISTSLAPEMTAFWRFFLMGSFFFITMVIKKKSFLISKKAFILLFLSALLMAAYNILFFWGLQLGFAGKSGVIVTTMNPLFAFLFSVVLFKITIKPLQIIGLSLGIAGGLFLIEIQKILAGGSIEISALIFVAAAALWASLTLISKKIQQEMGVIEFSFHMYSWTALLLAIFALFRGSFFGEGYSSVFWLNALYLAGPAGFFANSMYFFTVKKLGAHLAASFTFIVPASAVLLSLVFLGEIPDVNTIFGGILAISAVYLINFSRKKTDS